MNGQLTFTMIKPSAFEAGYTGSILSMIEKAGFRIKSLKKVKLTTSQAGDFYEMHRGKPFYEGLVGFMSSGPIVAAVLEKENAVEDFRLLIGATDPANAEPGTIRKLYGKNMGENAVHGSDSDESA
ncbi:MAG TPA: nucleoside-diphosphate kinase, partial [Bacteroidales bacterium]|nr:nucleoside-diphosphate kinase [Bacteroidales bacterium]